MSHEDQVVRALADIAVISERTTTHKSAKLGTVSPGSAEFDFMLAAFCFDLSRRLHYLFKATREFGPQADPALAGEVLADNDAINAPGLTWQRRAEVAEEIMRRLAAELGDEHDRLVHLAARK